jgi:putative membrane protein
VPHFNVARTVFAPFHRQMPTHEVGKLKRAAALAITAFVCCACAKKSGAAADATAAANTMAATDTIPASSTALASSWTDANIFAILDEANAADSSEGAIAAGKGTSAQVRDFGKQMMRDHHAMRVEGEALAKKLAITPQPAADDDSQSALEKSIAMLNNTAKGKDFDRAYIDLQVDEHKAVLEKAVRAMAVAQNTELKNLLQKAAPKVQAHLDKAETIQKSMK